MVVGDFAARGNYFWGFVFMWCCEKMGFDAGDDVAMCLKGTMKVKVVMNGGR